MQKRPGRQLRKKADSGSDDDAATEAHESAIAALKAKRAPGSKVKRPLHPASADEEVEVVEAPPAPAPPPAPKPVVVEPVRAPPRVVEEKRLPPALAAAKENAGGRLKARGGDADASFGLSSAPDFMSLDAKRRAPAAAPGKSRLEALVYPSSSDEGSEGEGGGRPHDNYDSLRAVKQQAAVQGGRAAAAKQAPSIIAPSVAAAAQAAPAPSLHDLIDRYSAKLAQADETCEQEGRDIVRLREDASASSTLLSKLAGELRTASAQFDFFQATRHWVRSVCAFLTAKAPGVAELEAAIDNHGADVAINASARLAADVCDEVDEAVARGYVKVIIAGALPPRPPESAEPVLGSVRSPEARILKRRARIAKAGLRSGGTGGGRFDLSHPRDGCTTLSDCEDSDSETLEVGHQLGLVLSARESLFSDALPEFSEMSQVCRRFQMWKKGFPQSYEDAYVSLSLRELFAPWIRLELLSWSPCTKPVLLSDFEWFGVLWPLIDSDSTTDTLIPSIVSSVVMPRLCACIRTRWNPHSLTQSRALAQSLQEVLGVEPDGDAIQSVVHALVGKLRIAVADVCVPVFIRLDGAPCVSQLTIRQFFKACKLLQSLCLFDFVVSMGTLVAVGMEELVSSVLCPAVDALLAACATHPVLPDVAHMLCLVCESLSAAMVQSPEGIAGTHTLKRTLSAFTHTLTTHPVVPPATLSRFEQAFTKFR